MADSLETIRGRMQSAAAEVWDSEDEDIQAAIQDLRQFYGDDARQVYRDAAFSSGSLRENMIDASEQFGVKEEFISKWQSDSTLQSLQYAVKNQFQSIWAGNTEAADEIYNAFQDANISELNTMCADGNYGDVMDELGDPDLQSPSNFAECARVVARVQGIGDTLEGMYRGN
jgi:hypothetical protein